MPVRGRCSALSFASLPKAPAVSSAPRKPPTKAPQVAPPVTTAVTVTPTTPPQPSTVETVTPQDTLAPTVTFTAVPLWVTFLTCAVSGFGIGVVFNTTSVTAMGQAPAEVAAVAHEVTGGAFAPLFWGAIGCLFLAFLLPFVMYLRRQTSVTVVVAAGLLANVAAVLKRFLIVVPNATSPKSR